MNLFKVILTARLQVIEIQYHERTKAFQAGFSYL